MLHLSVHFQSYQGIKYWYFEQSELIRQMQEKQQDESTVSKEQTKAKAKKK